MKLVDASVPARTKARISLPRWAGVAAFLAVILLDQIAPSPAANLPVAGVCDEAAHLATGLIVLAALRRPRRLFAAGVLAGSVLIDTDHLPKAVFGSSWLSDGVPRPYPHSLATLALIALIALCTQTWVRVVVTGVLVGVAVHLFRDLAEGSGVALLWPVSRHVFAIKPEFYYVVIASLAVVTLVNDGQRARLTTAVSRRCR